jgi:DNA-binding transcriptional regulator YdaS (Cro superfamily)
MRPTTKPRKSGVNEGFDKAVAVLGSKKLLAEALGIWPQAVYQWRAIPPMRVIEIEKLTGVSRRELRPDLHPTRGKKA